MVKIGELMMILDLHRQGLGWPPSPGDGQGCETIRRYIASGLEPPVYGPRPPQAHRLDPYKAYLQERITAYPQLSGRRLLREIRALGYDESEPNKAPTAGAADVVHPSVAGDDGTTEQSG